MTGIRISDPCACMHRNRPALKRAGSMGVSAAAKDDDSHIGIRMVTELAKDVRYFSAFNSNNLIVFLDLNRDEAARAAACLPASET